MPTHTTGSASSVAGDGDSGGALDHIVASVTAIFIGSVVEGVLGFGSSLTWMSIFPLFTSVQDSVGILQPLQFVLTLFLLVKVRKQCTPRALIPLAVTAPPGLLFGLWVVTSWSTNAIDCALGIFLLVYTSLKNDDESKNSATHGSPSRILKKKKSGLELDSIIPDEDTTDILDLREEEKKDDQRMVMVEAAPKSEGIPHAASDPSPLTHRHPHAAVEKTETPTPTKKTASKKKANTCNSIFKNPTSMCAGFVGGALMGAFGTGGPALLIYAKEEGWQRNPQLFRANLQLMFFAFNIAVCLSLYLEGIVTWQRYKTGLYLLPALFAGGQVGGYVATKVSRDKFKILVVIGLRIMGIMFLIEAAR